MRLTAREFDAVVEAAIDRIPAPFRNRLKNIVFLVEKEPPEAGLLGLYEGRPLTERSVSEAFSVPDRITIYQGPHERIADGDEQLLRRTVAETVWHEVAHYFGLSEEQVQRAERRREIERRGRSRRNLL